MVVVELAELVELELAAVELSILCLMGEKGIATAEMMACLDAIIFPKLQWPPASVYEGGLFGTLPCLGNGSDNNM